MCIREEMCKFAVMKLRIFPPEEMIEGSVTLPLSKSVANRRMIIDALAQQPPVELPDDLCGQDIQILRSVLADSDAEYVNVGLAGTAMRFLTAYFAVTPGRTVLLDGNERMRCRPIGPLVEALRHLGALINYEGKEGFPPLRITGGVLRGGEVTIDAGISSQFISALMLVAPRMTERLTLHLDGTVGSEPYIKQTLDMMQQRGIDAEYDRGEHVITVSPGDYTPAPTAEVERDWSAMSFWAELVAVTAGWITASGLDRRSAQADRVVPELFGQLGCGEAEPDEEESGNDDENSITLCGSPELTPRLIYDFRANPDLAQPAIVACCMIGVPFKATGLESLVIKETDRVTALTEELRKAGFVIDREGEGTLTWEGRQVPVADLPEFDARGDHRMAMSLAPVASFIPGITIDGAECVEKSYPGYWEQLAGLGFRVEEVGDSEEAAG